MRVATDLGQRVAPTTLNLVRQEGHGRRLFNSVMEARFDFTMDDLATRLGMSKRTIYRQWGNKTNIVREAKERAMERFAIKMEAIKGKGMEPSMELLEMVLLLFKERHGLLGHVPKKGNRERLRYLRMHNDIMELFAGHSLENLDRGNALGTYRVRDTKTVNGFFIGILGNILLHDNPIAEKGTELRFYMAHHLRSISSAQIS